MFNKDKDPKDKDAKDKDKDDADKPEKAKAIVLSLDATPGTQLTDAQHGWWATYNIVAGGMWTNPGYAALGRDYIHEQATLAAVRAHGEYPPDPPPEP